MDSLKDLLGNVSRNEPPEIAAIKDYVASRYKVVPVVAIRDQQIIITIPTAALAGTLRMHLPQMQEAAATDKKLVLRIGK